MRLDIYERNSAIEVFLYSDEWVCDESCIAGSLRCDGTINCQDGRCLTLTIVAIKIFVGNEIF